MLSETTSASWDQQMWSLSHQHYLFSQLPKGKEQSFECLVLLVFLDWDSMMAFLHRKDSESTNKHPRRERGTKRPLQKCFCGIYSSLSINAALFWCSLIANLHSGIHWITLIWLGGTKFTARPSVESHMTCASTHDHCMAAAGAWVEDRLSHHAGGGTLQWVVQCTANDF